jgi:hypothetical protein
MIDIQNKGSVNPRELIINLNESLGLACVNDEDTDLFFKRYDNTSSNGV